MKTLDITEAILVLKDLNESVNKLVHQWWINFAQSIYMTVTNVVYDTAKIVLDDKFVEQLPTTKKYNYKNKNKY